MPMESTLLEGQVPRNSKDSGQKPVSDCGQLVPSFCAKLRAHREKGVRCFQGGQPMPIKLAARPPADCALLALALIASTASAQAQYTAKEWPEGPMKQRFTEACGGCHDINRVRV